MNAPNNIVGTRWLSPCKQYAHRVCSVNNAGTPEENLVLSVECAATGELFRGIKIRLYDTLVAEYTPIENQ